MRSKVGEGRRMDGSSLQLEVMQKVPRLTKEKEEKGTEEKKKVKGWSFEDKVNKQSC